MGNKKTKLNRSLWIAIAGFLPFSAFSAQPAYQTFMLAACATDTGTLTTHCDNSTQGQLSGDSEDSMIPTQSLSNSANALAQTRARIRALLEKGSDTQETGTRVEKTAKSERITDTFQMDGVSYLLQAEYGNTKRVTSLLERGYETESVLLKAGADYRITDDWLIGAMIGYDQYDQTFVPDSVGTNFVPQANEGESDASNLSFSLFSTLNFSDLGYMEAMVSYTYSDYTFKRNVVFQNSARTYLVNVNTTADTNGSQWAVSLGAGRDFAMGLWSTGVYGRVDYQQATIDAYQESGGNGLAARFAEDNSTEVHGTLGLRASRVMPHSFGVVIPQLYVEYVHAYKADAKTTTSSLVNDTANNLFTTVGDTPDKNYMNLGFSLMTILPNGVSVFVGYAQQEGNDRYDYYRVNAGLRVEI